MFIETEHERENFIIPDTSVVWALRYKGDISVIEDGCTNLLSISTFSGLRKSSRIIKYSRSTANLLVIFEPWGPSAFFEEPIHEFFGQSIPTDYLKGYSHVNNLVEGLSVLSDNQKRVNLLEEILLTKLTDPIPDKRAFTAVQNIKNAKGNISITALANELCLSLDVLEKQFRQIVGTSPKHFSSIIKMRSAIDAYPSKKSFTEIALDTGYYDQAHFIKEFRTFTGKSPRNFFKDRPVW